ncbi:MAG TPA: Lpg1974 family pore-forming outer membrane protein [Gemmataceae bacterium]|nr:Lpg1974 family pore-forming outer membrane protein [Gemmataceae bacterium]
MGRMPNQILVLAILTAMLACARGLAQAPKALPPVDASPSTPAEALILPDLPRVPDAPRSLYQPLPPASSIYAPVEMPGPYFEPDPNLDPPMFPQPGWFGRVDAALVWPQITNGLNAASQISPIVGPLSGVPLTLPYAPFSVTVSPYINVGYRLQSGFGEIGVGYRFLGSSGTGTTAGLDATAQLTSHLFLNVSDLDYSSRQFSVTEFWSMKWHAGLRVATIYFDSIADEPLAAAAAGTGIFEQRTTDTYWGVGFHYGLELVRRLGSSGFALLLSADGSEIVGRNNQGYFEKAIGGAQGATLLANTQTVPALNAFAGLTWQPPEHCRLRATLGYMFDYWWGIGRMSSVGAGTLVPTPDAEMGNQGFVLRIDFNY